MVFIIAHAGWRISFGGWCADKNWSFSAETHVKTKDLDPCGGLTLVVHPRYRQCSHFILKVKLYIYCRSPQHSRLSDILKGIRLTWLCAMALLTVSSNNLQKQQRCTTSCWNIQWGFSWNSWTCINFNNHVLLWSYVHVIPPYGPAIPERKRKRFHSRNHGKMGTEPNCQRRHERNRFHFRSRFRFGVARPLNVAWHIRNWLAYMSIICNQIPDSVLSVFKCYWWVIFRLVFQWLVYMI